MLSNISGADYFTSFFVLIFVLMQISNIKAILKDKDIKGFDYRSMLLYIAWNAWSLFYIYPASDLYLASVVTFILLVLQIVWFYLAVKIKKKEYVIGMPPASL